ncbi:hypothetical protein IAE30_07340 [Pantoea sp. S61]|uniref:ABC-three component system middle component 5 n=1 Tax=Pantoea sp. S61 TaxID=2767442 RepID=UPI00190D2BD8|nr:ABC-three component system middle component 5 [Pantoea sp. S61]MBK0123556.1 hypothetical protein [Pantoea sp. S61]
MLIYHPLFDANHCVFRSLLLLEEQGSNEIDIDLFRMMDFYLLFPSLLKNISPFPSELKEFKKSIRNIDAPYENIYNPNRVFLELRRIQSIALHHLLSKQLIDMKSFNNGKVKRTSEMLPQELEIELNNSPIKKNTWFSLISEGFLKVEFNGSKGLKKRTGLMEYRYDEN